MIRVNETHMLLWAVLMCKKHLDSVLSENIYGEVSPRYSSRNCRYSGGKNDSLCLHRSYILVRKIDKI